MNQAVKTHQERIAELGQEVFSARRCELEAMKPYRAVRRRLGYIWDLPGPVGDGLINLVERVEDIYQGHIQDAVYDTAVIGAFKSGYTSGVESDGTSFATDEDVHRWLSEPASRADALVLLCELLEMQVPAGLQKDIDGPRNKE